MKRVPVVAYYASLLVIGGGVVFARELNPFFAIMALGAAGLVAVGSGLTLLGQAVYERSWQSWLRVAIAAIVLLAGYFAVPPLSHTVEYAQFMYRRARLEALVHDLLTDGRVQTMSDATRFYKDLKGSLARTPHRPYNRPCERSGRRIIP